MPTTVTVTLPSKRKPINDNLSQHTLLFAGEKKTGKTSFVAQWPDHFMLECEPGNASHIEANYEDIAEFAQADAYVDAVIRTPNYCKVLIVDQIQALYTYLCNAVRKDRKMDLDEKFSYVEWGMVRNYFSEFLLKLQKLQVTTGTGIIMTAHTEIQEMELRSGKKVNRLVADFTGQCKECLNPYVKMCGIIMAAPDGSRQMQIQGTDYVEAYHAFSPRHFVTPTGVALQTINLGFSPVTAFENFNKAYNNQYVPAQPAVQGQPTKVSNTLPVTKPKFSFRK